MPPAPFAVRLRRTAVALPLACAAGGVAALATALAEGHFAAGLPRLGVLAASESFRIPFAAGLVGVALAALATPVSLWTRLPRRVRGLGARGPAVAAAAVAAALLAAPLAVPRPAPPDAPHVVLLTVDTLRADHLGAWGYPRDTSPHIDGLAREGVRFAEAMVQRPKTGPSIASLFTSTHPRTSGVQSLFVPIPRRLVAMAESFRDAGYRTVGLTTNPTLAPEWHFDQGFEIYREAWLEAGNFETQDGGHVSDFAISFLEEREARQDDRPFFLWLHYVDPHARYEPPEGFSSRYVGDSLYDPTRKVVLNEGLNEDIGGVPVRSQLGTRDEHAFFVAQYDAEIRYLDAQIGRVLQALRRMDLWEDTVVALTADHGESLGEHDYYFEHGRLPYQACMHVPLIVRAPGMRAPGRVVETPVPLLDVAPTLLELAGLSVPPDAEGRSLARLVREGDAGSLGPARPVFAEAGYSLPDPQRVVRAGRWKLVHAPHPEDRALLEGEEWLLFDLESDPGETRNRIREEPEVAAELRDALARWRRGEDPSRAVSAEPPEVSGKTLEQLRLLGYVE